MRFAKKSGLGLIGLSLAGWLTEAFGGRLSALLGFLICKERYLQPVNGEFGDVSCGFNFDMYINSTCIVLLIVGVLLVWKSTKTDDEAR